MLTLSLPQLLEVFAGLPDIAQLHKPGVATRHCLVVSRALVVWLEVNSHAAALVELTIGASQLSPTALERWQITDPAATIHHWVVAIGDLYIDFTGRQFDAALPVPHIAPRSTFEAANWRVATPSD